MNAIAKLIVSAAVAAVLMVPAVRAAAEVGKPAPDFTLTDAAGKPQRLADFKGKIVVLEWVNSGCPVVRSHYDSGNMQSTQKLAAEQGVVWLQINTSERGDQGNMDGPTALAWQKQRGVTAHAYLQDGQGKVGRLYGAHATPNMFVIDAQGTLVYSGAIDSGAGRPGRGATNYVKAALTSLKDGKPIEVATSRAYGCAIHYPRNDS